VLVGKEVPVLFYIILLILPELFRILIQDMYNVPYLTYCSRRVHALLYNKVFIMGATVFSIII